MSVQIQHVREILSSILFEVFLLLQVSDRVDDLVREDGYFVEGLPCNLVLALSYFQTFQLLAVHEASR